MFRLSKKSEAPVAPEKLGGKGHPTPTRKQAEAAARARARAGGGDKKAAQKLLRERRTQENQKVREGMRVGDERYLMARDKGPVKKFVRDFVDVRLSFMEFLLPVLVVIMALQFSGQKGLASFSTRVWSASVLLLVVDAGYLMLRLNRELRRRFPDENTRGWRFYALMRAIQLRPLRLPKPRLKVRERLPERY
ncbi:MAG: DUF3043 domain-containing protein [Actinomycetota bacterium]|nr:DUF3043 domain-containing protein [Actinomycetota bacterium]